MSSGILVSTKESKLPLGIKEWKWRCVSCDWLATCPGCKDNSRRLQHPQATDDGRSTQDKKKTTLQSKFTWLGMLCFDEIRARFKADHSSYSAWLGVLRAVTGGKSAAAQCQVVCAWAHSWIPSQQLKRHPSAKKTIARFSVLIRKVKLCLQEQCRCRIWGLLKASFTAHSFHIPKSNIAHTHTQTHTQYVQRLHTILTALIAATDIENQPPCWPSCVVWDPLISCAR